MSVTDHQRVEWSAALRSNLEQLIDLHGIVSDRLDRHETLEKALTDALERVERERNEHGDALSMLSKASEDAVRRARLVGVKLEMKFLENAITEEVYRSVLAGAFPAGAHSVGATPVLRYEALERIVRALSQHDEADSDGSLSAIAREGSEAIEAANHEAKREQEETQLAIDAVSAARADFDRAYQASKEILSGLLRDVDRLDELRDVFPDM